MQLTVCEPTDTPAAAAMDPAGQAGFLQSSGGKAEGSAASLEDVMTDTANESSEEESAGEREQQIRDDKDIVITTSNTQRGQWSHTHIYAGSYTCFQFKHAVWTF